MPTLRLVPDQPSEPDDVALEAVDDATTPATVPVQWFPCADSGVAGAVRAHVLTALNAWAVDTDTMADAMVLVSELVTNVRDHTDSDAVGIRVRVSTDRIVVAVIEQVPVDAPSGGRLFVADPDDPDVPPHERGRGLRILDSMASEWGFVRRSGVTTTWFALPASPPVSPDRAPEIRRF